MATRPQEQEDRRGEPTEADHDAFVRSKVKRGLAESHDRATLIPLEQAWRDLAGER